MAYPELLTYVQKARQKGMADDVIRARLASTGWHPTDINGGFRLMARLVSQGEDRVHNSSRVHRAAHRGIPGFGIFIFALALIGLWLFVLYSSMQ